MALALQANNKELGEGLAGLQSPDSYNLGGGNGSGPNMNNGAGIVGSQGNFNVKQQQYGGANLHQGYEYDGG